MSTQTTAPTATMIHANTFSASEWRTLDALRLRYQQDRDLFGMREFARLRFLRWLCHTGRLTS